MKGTKVELISGQVYKQIVRLRHSKFTELCSVCNLESKELYAALLHLIQQGKVRQEWNTDGFFYCTTEEKQE